MAHLPRQFLIAAAGVALLATTAAGQSFRQTPRSVQFRALNTSVSINVPASAFNPVTGVAVVTVARSVLGQVSSTKHWNLKVQSDRHYFSNSLGANDKPCSDLGIRPESSPSFQELATHPTIILSGTDTNGDWLNVAFDLRFTAHLKGSAGTYTLNLVFDIN